MTWYAIDYGREKKKPKKRQKAKWKFSCQTGRKKARFLEFGVKKANMATLLQSLDILSQLLQKSLSKIYYWLRIKSSQ